MPLRRNREYPSAVALLTGAVAILLGACGGEDLGQDTQVIRPVRTAVATTAPSMIRRTYPAVVLPAQQAELAFRVSGRIVDLPVRAATQVKRGEPIAQLDKREFEAAVARLESQREKALSELAAMESGARSEDLAALQAKVAAAKAQLDKQRTQVGRFEQLARQGTIARADLEAERAKLASDEANLDVAQQELKKAQVGARTEEIAAQEATIRDIETQLSEAIADLEDTTLRAPFDGIIASRNVDNFTNVQANSVVAVLQKLDTIDLQYDVPGIDVATFGQQNNVVTKARLDVAPGREFDAQLVEFGTEADAATQTFRARASIPYPEDVTVLPGMTGSIVVSVEQAGPETFTIPESALAAEPDGSSYVWVVKKPENAVTRRTVTPESLSGGDVSVSGDLTSGDIVVTAGVSFLHEGMIVNPTTEGMQ
jgi:multidrug efflux pump subunit AcrA (membrane-fusion protein)